MGERRVARPKSRALAADLLPLGWQYVAVDIGDLQANVRYLLGEWDPIGVADAALDEYDCLIGPLVSNLGGGSGCAEISEYLWFELEDHFGLDPARYEVDAMANRLVAWWAAVAGQG